MKTKEQILTKGLRENLKCIMHNEIDNIPELLEELEPRDRLNMICKLMPYVFPKLETISSSSGEPFTFDF